MSNVIDLNVTTTIPMSAEKVLNSALKADLEDVVIIARNKDGELWFLSTSPDGGEVLWLMEIAKKGLLE